MSFHLLDPFVSSTDEYDSRSTSDLLVLFCGVYVLPTVFLVCLLWFLRKRLTSLHRRVLGKMLDLLVLSQILIGE